MSDKAIVARRHVDDRKRFAKELKRKAVTRNAPSPQAVQVEPTRRTYDRTRRFPKDSIVCNAVGAHVEPEPVGTRIERNGAG